MTQQPQRVQRKRTKGWKMPENTVYVGRGSQWGNPFKVGCGFTDPYGQWRIPENNRQAVSFFNSWAVSYIPERQGVNPSMIPLVNNNKLDELKGKNLACWCRLDQHCHADILLKLANEPKQYNPDDWTPEQRKEHNELFHALNGEGL